MNRHVTDNWQMRLNDPEVTLPFVNGVLEYGEHPISVTFSVA